MNVNYVYPNSISLLDNVHFGGLKTISKRKQDEWAAQHPIAEEYDIPTEFALSQEYTAKIGRSGKEN